VVYCELRLLVLDYLTLIIVAVFICWAGVKASASLQNLSSWVPSGVVELYLVCFGGLEAFGVELVVGGLVVLFACLGLSLTFRAINAWNCLRDQVNTFLE